MKTNPSNEKLAEEIFLGVLCRLPSKQEMAHAVSYIKTAPNLMGGAQDLMWALVNSPAFLFNR